ncbi:MAG: trypsin-like peptidase domain-containing protein [Lachnospiraceae bacterium]|nr:trypsin-like peptidase domain-containing protein [Lachnospiraceae bacterium]
MFDEENKEYFYEEQIKRDYYSEPQPQIVQPAKKSGGFKKVMQVIGLALLFGAVSGSMMFGISYFGKMYLGNGVIASKSESPTRDISNVTIMSNSQKFEDSQIQAVVVDVSDVVQAVMPSVVIIEGKVTTTGMFGQTSVSGVCGSGIIIGKNDTELLVVTNAHVVEDAQDITVEFIDENKVSATVKGLKSNKDLAVLAISLYDVKDTTLEEISIAEIGDSNSVKVGSAAIAIGNALGYGQSVTVGVISALDREVKVEGVTHTLIQTDAAINPGNSGGALIDAYGKVIGINSAKLTDTEVEGMGYAIPISSAMDIITELMNSETRQIVPEAERGYMGISGKDIDATASAYLGYPQGVLLTQVGEDSPAEDAGLKGLDIIIGFDGEEISTMEQLKKLLQYYRTGETVEIEFYRQEGNQFVINTVQLTLGSN